MKINPQKFTWTAPTHNTDETPIVGELAYRLMLDGVDFADFPGSLNPDGQYEVAVADLNIPNGQHDIALKAFYVDAPELISDPSNVVQIATGVARPKGVADFAAG